MMYFFQWLYKWICDRERESDLERQPSEDMATYLQRVMEEWDRTFKEGRQDLLDKEE